MTDPIVSANPFLDEIRKNRFFKQLNSETLVHFIELARKTEYKAGETVFHEGDPAQGLFWLASGTLKVVKSSISGKEQTLQFIKSGTTFNEIGAFSTLPNPASVIALEPSAVWRIPSETIRQQRTKISRFEVKRFF